MCKTNRGVMSRLNSRSFGTKYFVGATLLLSQKVWYSKYNENV